MEFNEKPAKARRLLTIAALVTGTTLGSFGVGALVATAMAGNAPSEIVTKPPCVMQPRCKAAVTPEKQVTVPAAAAPTLDTLALYAALQSSSVFGLVRVLHEPDPTPPDQKWCKNLDR